MSFYFKGYDRGGYYVVIPTDLAVLEARDTAAFVIEVTLTYADLAVLESADTWSGPLVVTTFGDFAVSDITDSLAVDLQIIETVDLSATETPDVLAGTVSVTLGADLDALDEVDTWASGFDVIAQLALAATDLPDIFHGGAFVGYFFLPEQEVLYVASENTVMRVPANNTTITIQPELDEIEPLPVETVMKTKKRNRSKLQ
jgi:hypothetical protein